MNTKRTFAYFSLTLSCCALIASARISWGDQPGVIRMASKSSAQDGTPAPESNVILTPQPDSSVPMAGPQMGGAPASGTAVYGMEPSPGAPMYGPPADYTPYFENSGSATESPVIGRRPYENPLFGPMMMFETNIGDGLGYDGSWQRFNARIPYHVVPGNSVLMGDLSASITNQGQDLYNFGLIWRNYDALRNRIFGWNFYGDIDDGRGNIQRSRLGFGMESLGKYLDFRANGYFVSPGDDSVLLTDNLIGDLTLRGNNVFRVRNQTRDNAYSGLDFEAGGPLPVLGRRGVNMYLGGYYLDSDWGNETYGFSAHWQAYLTESATVDVRYTNDDTFGVNTWVSVSYTIPNYRENAILEPRCVRDRLADPVYRNNRIHTHIDVVNVPEAVIRDKTGAAWNIVYVDPNATTNGVGTRENPYSSLQVAANNNNAGIDIIRVVPNADDSSTNLTVNGGLQLFDCQVLLSSTKDFTLFSENGQDFIIPGQTTATGLGALISNPTITAGGSVIQLANENVIAGMRIDASNAAGTVFGTGVANALPITDATLSMNTFQNYVTGANLQDVTGYIVADMNTFNGLAGTSQNGLVLTTAMNSSTDLLIRNNTTTANSVVGISVTAGQGATINADNPNAFSNIVGATPNATGVTGNTTTGGGTGIQMLAQAGSVVNAVVEDNTSTGNTGDGFSATADAGTFNLASLRNNNFSDNLGNGAFLRYTNGGIFNAATEDLNADTMLGIGEDVNGNGLLDQGIVSNTFSRNSIAGLCIFGDGSGTGDFDIGGPLQSLGNTMQNNLGAGAALDLTGTAVAGIDSMFNTITDGAFGQEFSTQVQASFMWSGNTLSQAATLNNASANADILQFSWNLDLPAGTQDWELDTTTFNNTGTAFTTLNGSEVTTGLIAVNGVVAPPITTALQLALDRQQKLEFDFANDPAGIAGFDSNETFAWQIDVDSNGLFDDTSPDDIVIANQLAGTTGSVTFRDDFAGNGVQSTRTVFGTFVQSATDPLGLELNIDQTFTAPVFNSAPNVQGIGMRVTAVDNSRITHFNSTNDNITRNKGDGITFVASNNAMVDSLTIQGATVEQNGGRGLNLEAHDAAVINANNTIGGFNVATGGQNIIAGVSFPQANSFSRNGSDGIRFLAGNGGTINGNVINNTINENLGDGVAMLVDDGGTLNFGDAVNNEIISQNTIQSNNGAGIRLTSNVTAAGPTGVINALIQNNTLVSNSGGGIVSELNGPSTGGVQNNTINLVAGGTSAQANTINGNSNVGIGMSVAGNGVGNLDVRNATITGTFNGSDPLSNGDAIFLSRADSSLLTATIENVTATGNEGAGLAVDVQGNDKTDPSQPMSGTVNTVTWNENNFSSNGEDGARFVVRGDAQLIADGENNVVSNNGANGISISTEQNASFGDATDGLPPGRRVLFNGTTASGNAGDGINISATDNSRVLLEVTSNRTAATTVGAHAGLNTNGDTNISGNASDGIQIASNGGASDILITSGTGQTTIANNGGDIDGTGPGVAAGGNGIRWDASGTSDGIVRVDRTIITGNVAGATEDANGNGVLDAGEDLNGNGDLDVTDGDGIQYNVTGTATATLIAGGIGAGNVIQNNDDDGIAITATGSGNSTSRPIITIVGNTIGGEDNGNLAGNGGDGVSMNIFGGTATGLAPAAVDFTGPLGDGTPLSPDGGVQENGPIVQLTLTDNVITNNFHRGANLLLHGAAGERDRENNNALFDPVRITLTGNTISSNGDEGVYYRADADMNQSRIVFLANPTIGPPGARTLLFNNTNYSPFRAEFTSLNTNSVNGNTAYLSPYLNLRTVQNSFFTATGNTIQNNGVNTITGEGMFIEVGTGAYVAADVRDNVFGGNLEEDFHTESFLSAGNSFTSMENNAADTFDFVYLDDTAQLDLRFTNNSGNQINVTSSGATYTNNDPLKIQFLGALGVVNRDADLFQVDDGNNLDNPNNTFINFGITQDMDGSFSTGGYNLRGIADPLFPNLGFPPFLP